MSGNLWLLAAVLLPAVCRSVMAQSFVPGSVIAHQSATSGLYLGSPSRAILPGGDYVASHDDFGPRSALDQTTVFRSHDRGLTWQQEAQITGQYWSTLFVHRSALYLLGTSREYGNVVIRRSDDGGRRWITPTDDRSGLLLSGGQYHCAPGPVTAHVGRLWRAFERREPPTGWAEHFSALMLSVPESADLLDARQWRTSAPLPCDPTWNLHGWLEGNAVVTPSGHLVDILRTGDTAPEKAAVVTVSDDGRQLHFAPTTGLMPFPGGCKKFTIRFDPKTRLYWSLSNDTPRSYPGIAAGNVRNTLTLISSPDLTIWKVRSVVLRHPDPQRHGFQYIDWQFDGEDIVFVSRTAYEDGLGGAHSAHDANFLTFHRLFHFRK